MKIPTVGPNVAIGVPFALFVVWMQRQKRWSLMIKAMDGTVHLRPRNS